MSLLTIPHYSINFYDIQTFKYGASVHILGPLCIPFRIVNGDKIFKILFTEILIKY